MGSCPRYNHDNTEHEISHVHCEPCTVGLCFSKEVENFTGNQAFLRRLKGWGWCSLSQVPLQRGSN